MKKLQRWYVGQWNYHGAPNDSGDWCASAEVALLEASRDELLKALENLVSELESNQLGVTSPSPEEVRSVLAKSRVVDETPALIAAKAAIAKAKREEP